MLTRSHCTAYAQQTFALGLAISRGGCSNSIAFFNLRVATGSSVWLWRLDAIGSFYYMYSVHVLARVAVATPVVAMVTSNLWFASSDLQIVAVL